MIDGNDGTTARLMKTMMNIDWRATAMARTANMRRRLLHQAILMGVLVSGNIGDSIWVAYTAARDLNGGGHPVLVHVVISFLILAIFSGVWIVSEGAEPWPVRLHQRRHPRAPPFVRQLSINSPGRSTSRPRNPWRCCSPSSNASSSSASP